MNLLFVFLIPLLMAALIAAMAKLATRIVRAGALKWKHGFFLAGFLFTLSMTAQVIIRLSGARDIVPPLFIGVLGVLMTAGFSAWYLGHHVVKATDEPIGLRGGATVAATMFGLMLALAVPAMMILPPP